MANVLITGCSSGFGKLAALEFARRGDTVYASMRNLERSDALRREAAAEGLEVECLRLDVTDPKTIQAAIDQIGRDAGGVDVLVNNAGVVTLGPIEYVHDEELRDLLDTNVLGVVRVTQAVLPYMRRKRNGVVINIGSISGLVANPLVGIYAATKHALEAVTRALYFELKHFGVRVHIINPGNFGTDIWSNLQVVDQLSRPDADSAYRALLEKLTTVDSDQLPPASDVAQLIVRVAHDDAAPFRHLIGEDAKELAAMDEQQHARWVREVLDP